MAAPMPMSPRPPDAGDPVRRYRPSATPVWLIGAVLASAVVVLGLLVILLARQDGGSEVDTIGSTTEVTGPTLPVSTSTSSASTSSATDNATTSAPSTSAVTTDPTTTATTTSSTGGATTSTNTSTSTVTSTATTVDPTDRPIPAVWPFAEATTRFTDPVAAATSFAEDFVGFVDPVIGPYHAGDSRSGEVEIKPAAAGPTTVVFVRQLGPADTWWVIGAATADIALDEPDTLDTVTSPLTVRGEALAFEGVVAVALRADGATDPLATTTVIAGGTEMGPFEGTLVWDDPDAAAGALVLSVHSAENGQLWAVSVIRVEFAS